MTVISTDLVPPGGWRFTESGFYFEKPTFKQLVDLVADHRKANGKPAGNPRQEIMDQIGEKHPSFILNQPAAMTSMPDKFKSFVAALKNYLLGGGQLVDQNTANIRSEICAGCHNNVVDNSFKGCAPCGGMLSGSLNFIRAGILHGRKTSGDPRLKSCALCGCDLKLKVWFPVKYFDPNAVEKNKWPSFCWMKE